MATGYDAPRATESDESTDRRTSQPYGLNGGHSGALSANTLNLGANNEELIPSKPHRAVGAGDTDR